MEETAPQRSRVGDIATGQDALAIEWYGMIDAIVTTRHTAATAADSVDDAPQDRTEDPAGDDIHIDRTCAQCGPPGGNGSASAMDR
jgi:hypothetical protein